ncbi:MAG: S1 family peptidase [Myxococcota bacterium]
MPCRNLRWSLPLSAAWFCLSGCGADPAPHPEERPGILQDAPGLNPAELEDLSVIARERGWTLDQAIERVGWEEAYDRAVSEIRAAHPDTFSGSVITPEASTDAWMGFAGEIPDGVVDHPAFAGIDIELHAHLGYSEEGLHSQLLEVHHAIRAAGYPDVLSAYNVEDGTIDVSVGTEESSLASHELFATLPASARAPNVRLNVGPSHHHANHLLSGGNHLNGCTAGFNVRSGSTDGMLTAGHCGRSVRILPDAGGAMISLSYRASHEGRWGDFGWHTTTRDTFRTFFQYDTGRRREVWRMGQASKGRTLCRYGRTTPQRCDTVHRVNVSSGGEDRLAMMKNNYADHGDSGGPWFYGSTAYGVHEGGQQGFLWKWRSVWSQLVYIDDALNLTLMMCQPLRTRCAPGDCGTVPVGCGRNLYCGVCGGCSSDRDCTSASECGRTGGQCSLGVCNCY